MTPRISVIMPVHNGERYLAEAVKSILGQSTTDLELIAVNDGSTDQTEAILDRVSRTDSRLIVLRPGKVGFVGALNLGIQAARGDYLARMDADDVALPSRLARQIEFLDAHPEVTACGTAIEVFADAPGHTIIWPETPRQIRPVLLFHSPLCHPTVVMRKLDLERHDLSYREEYHGVADYDLWCQMDRRGLNLANLPDVLLRYRRHAAQITTADRPAQEAIADRVRREQLAHYGVQATALDLELHCCLARWETVRDLEQLAEAGMWLGRLGDRAAQVQHYPHAELQAYLANAWYLVCVTSVCRRWDVFQQYRRGPLGKGRPLRALRLGSRFLRDWLSGHGSSTKYSVLSTKYPTAVKES